MDRRDDSEHEELVSAQQQLTEQILDAFVKLASGDFSVRVARNYTRDLEDTLAYFVNLIVEELARSVAESEESRIHLAAGVDELNRRFLEVASGNFSVRAPRNETGDPLDVLSFFFNTTVEELDAAFRKERRQQSLLRAVFDAMTDGIILLDDQGAIQQANGAAKELLAGAIRPGRRLSELLAARDQPFARGLETDARAFQGRETLFVDGRGQLLLLVLSGQPLHHHGMRRGMVLSVRDERALRQAQTQLQASDRMATMGTLAAGVAHEINNPMSYVISNLEYALEELQELEPDRPLPAEIHRELIRALQTSKTGADRVSQSVRDLKSISQVDEESLARVNVQHILDTSASMLRGEIRDRARLVKEYGETPPILVNEARLVQVSLNLIQHAAQAIEAGTPSENVIRLMTGTSSTGELIFAVSDTGGGFTTEALASLFHPFHSTGDTGASLGLGLSISKRLIEGMGGRLEVESEVRRGTTIRVFIPPTRSSPT